MSLSRFRPKPKQHEVGPPKEHPLSREDVKEFEELKNRYVAIEKNSWIEKSKILQRIKHQRFYREHYETFEKFCEDVFDLTARRANQLLQAIRSAEVIESEILPNVTNGNHGSHPDPDKLQLPLSERHIRELQKLPSEQMRIASAKLKGKDKITQKDVEKAVKDTRRESKPKTELAPAGIVEMVAKGEAVIRACRTILASADWPESEPITKSASKIAASAPYCDCFYCGKVGGKCVACEGRGWLNQAAYDNADEKNQKKAKARSKVSFGP